MSSGDDKTVFGGRYRIRQRIGRGGMASVYLAEDELLGRPVALKVVEASRADEGVVERFRREARAAAKLNHPNVVAVYDWGEHAGNYYLVMEYVDGPSLDEVISQRGRFSVAETTRLIRTVAIALGSAHDQGLVHRDVKPGNVLIANDGTVKVADFGIATALTATTAQNLTAPGTVLGTASYLPPEQALGHVVDRRADLYSLGVVMYELLSGKPPFAGSSPVSLAYQHVQEPVPPLRERGVDAPQPVAAIVMRLLEKDPANRFQTAQELVDTLDDRAAAFDPQAVGPAATTRLPIQPKPAASIPAVQGARSLLAGNGAVLFLVGLLAVGLIVVAIQNLPLGGSAAPVLTGPDEGSTIDDGGGPDASAVVNDPEFAAVDPTPVPTLIPTAPPPEPTIVPTAIAEPSAESTVAPVPTPEPTDVPSPTTEPSAVPSPTGVPTVEQTPTLSPTPEPTATAEATPVVSPTAEPTPTETATVEPTAMPTPTEAATVTAGPLPPSGVLPDGLALAGDEFSVRLHNQGTGTQTIATITIEFPAANAELREVKRGANKVLDLGDGLTSPVTIAAGIWPGSPANREIDSGAIGEFRFKFDQDAAGSTSDYIVSFTFADGNTLVVTGPSA